MKSLKTFLSLVSVLVLAFMSLAIPTIHADFNPNRVIDDSVFDNVNSMSINDINSFLNSFPSSCISTNNGFSSPDPTGYSPSSGYTYGGNVSGGQVIYDAAQAYHLNPQVILATLQKESSVVTGTASYHCDYINTAMGYGCPDSGSCPTNPATMSGFSKQVIHATWLFKFGQQRSLGNTGWNVQANNFPQSGDHWDNSDDPPTCYGGPMTEGNLSRGCGQAVTHYDGYTSIDGSTVHMDTGGTAALYWYTPHFSGNQHFVTIFEQTFNFGSTTSAEAQFAGESNFPTVFAGQSSAAYLKYKNVSSVPWYDDTTASGAGAHPLHLATTGPINRGSAFGSTWPLNNRPAFNFAHVYEANGTTLAANQHVAQPGQIVEFDFTFTIPAGWGAGYYQEFFQPVLEGASNWNLGGVAWLGVTVQVPTYNASFVGESNFPTITAGQSSAAYLKYKNVGNVPWYDDTTAPGAGVKPVHLAGSNPVNRGSAFASGSWYMANRPNNTFSHVYESNGTTLAANQHVAQPGQIVEFDFTFTIPAGWGSGSYQEYFRPLLDGAPNWNMNGEAWLRVTVNAQHYAANWAGQSSYPSIPRGSSAAAYFRYKNVGNVPWYDDTTASAAHTPPVHLATSSPVNRNSTFASNSWYLANRPNNTFSHVYEPDGTTLASNQHVAQPGQIVEFDFTFTAASNAVLGTTQEAFQPVLEGAPNWDIGAWAWLKVTVTT